MRLLVTGGSGFMGSNAIRFFLRERSDCHIVNLDKLTYAGNPENLRDVENDSRYTFVKGDIAVEADVEAAFSHGPFDAVINYAAETHVDRSILDPSAFVMTDVIGTYRLLEAVRKYAVPRFVQISTDEVFGVAHEHPFREEDRFDPSSPYSASKAGADLLISSYVKTYGTPAIVTHSCNFYGPYQYPEKLIPLFITNLLEGKRVPVYGDGRQVREWIFTEDHCRAVLTILEKGRIGAVYNIGTGDRMENIDVTKKLLALTGVGEEMIEHVPDRAAHDVRYEVDSTRLRTELGWSPTVSFEDGLALSVAWYKEHRPWWEAIKSGDFLRYYEQQYGARHAK
jgi:dTDP-glucose 4,6-dehydratase